MNMKKLGIMKELDKLIIKIISVLSFTALVLFMQYDFLFSLQVIGGFLLLAYGIFIVGHLFLCYPLVVICFITQDYLENINWIENLEKESLILYHTVKVIIQIPILIFIYLVLPVIFAMMINNSFDIDLAFQLLNEINNGRQ